jgi:hypothetical protein
MRRNALIPARRVLQTIQENSQFLQRLGMTAAARCRDLASSIAAQHGWPVTARVARALLAFASDARRLSPAKPQLEELAQRDLAAAQDASFFAFYAATANVINSPWQGEAATLFSLRGA